VSGPYSIILTELTTKSDLRAIVGAISNVLNVDKREAVEKAKKLPQTPLTLATNLPEKEAKLMADMFSSMGAGIKVSPPLDEPPARQLRELRTELPKRGIPLGCLIFMMLCMAGFATFASLKYEWIIEQVEIWLKPSPEKSDKLLKQGRMNEAKQSIQKQLREKPNDVELLTLQGRYYIGVARQRMNDKQWKNYGEAGAMPELDSATAFFRKAESLDPKDSNIPRWISVAEQMRRNLPEAETYARRAVTIAPQVEDNWNQLGSVLVDEDHISQAEKAFYNALKIDQSNAAALKNLAILNLYYTKDAERASKFLFSFLVQKEAEADMDSYQLRTDLTTAMIGDFNQPWEKLTPPPLSFDEYEKRRAQIAANPNLNNDPLLQEQLGMLYMSRGEAKTAVIHFTGAIHLNQKVESSRKMLAIIYMKDENYESALKMMEAAVEHGARDPFFSKNIGVLQKYFKANPAEANKAFSRYLALGGDFFENRIKKEM
jgi:tetratricopeptide (TPR) repeat protein